MKISLASLDYLIIALYFVLVFVVAFFVTRKEDKSADDYFLGGRNLGWFAIGASLFASNIGSEHLIGLAGSGADSGVAVAQFEILAGIILLVLGWVFVPFYIRSGVTTMPEFLELRYNKFCRDYLSFISIIAYVLTKISVTIFAGATVFEAIGFEFWTGAVVVVVATGIYTVFGGLKAVIYTDLMQMFIIIFGAIAVTVLGLNEIGGFDAIRTELEPSFLSMWRPMTDKDFPWTGILFGAPILGVWYWCTDQFIVQRVLSAKNLSEARRGTLFGGFLKQLPLFLFVVPGMICAVMVSQGKIVLDETNHALPKLISTVLPIGFKGLVIAGLLAALMSSLSSVFNSCSTLITYDFFKRKNPNMDEKTLIKVGQFSTVVLVIFGLLWIPLMKLVSGNLFNYLQSVQAYISPPIASVFLLGLFSKKLNAKGAMSALLSGFVLGITRLICEINKDSLDGVMLAYTQINFLHFALFLFVICSAILIIVSLVTGDTKESVKELVFDFANKKTWTQSDKSDFILSMLLLTIIGIIWVIFS